MAKCGLTHGGFYAHFESKDDLVAQALVQMFEESYGRFVAWTADKAPAAALAAYIDNYLSSRHRDVAGRGCPLPVMSAELPRLSSAARANYATGYARLSGSVAKLLREVGREDAAALAGSVVAEMVGTMTLARALGAAPQSDKLLKNARVALRARLGL
jgi:TetR/AcrR family transcriptional repressor of nem operon